MAFSLTVPAYFDGDAYRRGRHTLHLDGEVFAPDAVAEVPHLDLVGREVTAQPGLIDAHVHLAITHTDAAAHAPGAGPGAEDGL